jgi:formate hydrogenlyase subunit 3/multisubunit Na+/H+ antiporter MnhD subunit
MPDPLLLAVILPLFGAGCLFLASRLSMRFSIEKGRFGILVVALVVAVVVFALVLALRMREDRNTVVLVWRSSLLADSSVRLGPSTWLWPMGLILSLVVCCLLAAELGTRHNASPLLAPVALGLLGGGLAALWSANPLTTIISWTLCDLFLMLGQIIGRGKSEDVARRLALGSLSILLLWAGVVAAGDGTGGVQWSLMPPGGIKMTLWTLAGLLRLGVYPFLFSTARPVSSSSPLVAILLFDPVIGWALWMRLLLVGGGVVAEHTWIVALALLTLGVGGFLGWAVKSPEEGRSWIGMGVRGAVLLATVLASLLGRSQGIGESVALLNVTLGVTGWMLSVVVLFLGGHLDRRRAFRPEALPRSIPSLLGALSLLGVPPTLGFVTEASLMRSLASADHWGWTASFFVGQVFLFAAVTRWLFPAVPSQRPETVQGSRFRRIAYSSALTCAALLLVVVGVAPALLVTGASRLSLGVLLTGPGATGWLLWAATLIFGSALGWFDAYIRPRVVLWLDVLQDILRLDWAYGLVAGAFEQGLTVLRTLDSVLGGRGALLWSSTILLLLILVWRVS